MDQRRGKNSISSKRYNRGLVLRLIASGECTSRIELSRSTGLAKMTVSNIVSEFLERGLIKESEEELTEACGRNPRKLKISHHAPKAAGLLIFRDRIEAVLCTLDLQILDTEHIYFQELTREKMMEYAYRALDRILEKEKNLLGIGAAVIGPVDTREGILLNPPRFYGIEHVKILEALKARYPYPIYLDHDNNSAALAEKLYGAGKDCQDFLFLGISNGIGSGVISGGEVYHSSRGLSPEIGHVSIDCQGPSCSCGSRGCLELYANTHVVLEKLRNATGLSLEFGEFFHLKDHAEAREILSQMVRDISAALVSAMNLFNPELIVLGHDCMDWSEEYVQMLETLINEKKMAQGQAWIPVKKAYFGKNAQLAGAAANVVNQVFLGELLWDRTGFQQRENNIEK